MFHEVHVFIGITWVFARSRMSTPIRFQTQGLDFLLPGRLPREEWTTAMSWAACIALTAPPPRWLEERITQLQITYPRRLPPGQGVSPHDAITVAKMSAHLRLQSMLPSNSILINKLKIRLN